MNARNYLYQIVAPTIADYAQNVRSVRHAFLACVATFHTIDYFAKGREKNSLRTHMRKECTSFRLIDRIAHAFKHTESSDNLKVQDVVERPPAFWGTATWNLSRWGDAFGGVTLAKKPDIDLLDELNVVLTYLRSRLPPVEDEWIKAIQLWATNDPRINSVYIFGSRATGQHHHNSDLDLAVQLTGNNVAERDTYTICKAEEWRTKLSSLLPVKVDLQWINSETDTIVWPAVSKHGIKIYPLGF
jgi:predicted nucleotidyltransferase